MLDETYRELNQQVNEVEKMLNSFIQKLTAQVELFLSDPFSVHFNRGAVCQVGGSNKNDFKGFGKKQFTPILDQ